MKEILLSKGKFALVDNEDFERINQHKWYYSHGYAARDTKDSIVYMHREIMNTPKGIHTDHKNGNKTDNRKENLRNCTASENGRNRDKQSNNKSGYKGVTWHIAAKKWQATIRVHKISTNLGLFENILDAARAYNQAALEYHGEFVKLNTLEE